MKHVAFDEVAQAPPFCRLRVGERVYRPVFDYVAVEHHAGRPMPPDRSAVPLRLSYLLALADDGEGQLLHDGDLLPARSGTVVLSSPHTRRDLAAAFPRGVTWRIVLFNYVDEHGDRLRLPIRDLLQELADEPLVDAGPTVHASPAAAGRLAEAFDELQRQWRPHPIPWLPIHRRFLDLLLCVIEELLLPRSHLPTIPPGLLAVKDEIDRRYREYLPLAELARLAGITPNHLCRRFKESFGHPPRTYQMMLQMRYAKALLSDRAYRVNEVAAMAGFPSRHHFSRLFKERTGLSPVDYRLAGGD